MTVVVANSRSSALDILLVTNERPRSRVSPVATARRPVESVPARRQVTDSTARRQCRHLTTGSGIRSCPSSLDDGQWIQFHHL